MSEASLRLPQQNLHPNNSLRARCRRRQTTSSVRHNVIHATLQKTQTVKICYRGNLGLVRYNVESAGEWIDKQLDRTTNKGWGTVVVELAGPSDKLTFALHDGNGTWDNNGSKNYVVSKAGTYRLGDGELAPLPPSLPVLVVSDLDGTMIGDDAATEAFTAFWHKVAPLTGSKLVYSTGRTLDSFLSLASEKGAIFATPDALICAVGTKIYKPDHTVSNGWREDTAWSAQLDEGWDEAAAREAAYKALNAVGKEVAHFRPADELGKHKLTLGVRDDAVGKFEEHIRGGLQAAGVRAKVITSGHGGWKYVDVVSAQAGKLESLEHVRGELGFALEATVACGDSGNDILMMSGRNRALVVGNAQPDLLQWVQSGGNRDEAQSRQRLYVAKKGHAFGILEGLAHWGFA